MHSPIRVAIADPPYPGNSKRCYGGHRDYAGEVDHKKLIARLEEEFPDGWALCTGAKNAQEILDLCPPVRQLIWLKPGTPLGDGFLWCYEPVLLRGCRPPQGHVPDVFWSIPRGSLSTFRALPDEHVIGAKPKGFCRWLFEAMGLHREDDEVVDLFRGSGAIGKEWDAWCAEPSILSEMPSAEDQLRLVREVGA